LKRLAKWRHQVRLARSFQFPLNQLIPEPPTLIHTERMLLAAGGAALGARYPAMVFDTQAERNRPSWVVLI